MTVNSGFRRELTQMDRSDIVEQVTLQNANNLKLSRGSLFTSEKFIHHISEHPRLVWRLRAQNEYVVGAPWRHRSDIGHVIELTQGRGRELLLKRITEVFWNAGAKLTLIAQDDYSLYLAFYAKFGFERLDEVVELELATSGELPPAPSVVIRAMLPEDLSAVLAVDQAAFPWLWYNSREELVWYSAQEGVEICVAIGDSREVVGYAGLTIRGREGHLDRLAVLPRYQGTGYGKALLRFCIERMAQVGVRRLALSTQSSNTRSQQLYRWFGFRPTFRSHKIYGLRLDGGQSAVE